MKYSLLLLFLLVSCSEDVTDLKHLKPELNQEKLMGQVGRIGSHNAMIIIGLLKFDKTGKSEDIPMKQIGEHLGEINKIVNEMESDLGDYYIQ